MLKSSADKIADKEAVLIMTAKCQMEMGNAGEAEAQYLTLVDMCPENAKFLRGLARCKGVDIRFFHEVRT